MTRQHDAVDDGEALPCPPELQRSIVPKHLSMNAGEIRNRVNGESVSGRAGRRRGAGGGEAELRRLAQPRLGLRRRAQRAGEADLAEEDRVARQRDVLAGRDAAPRRPRGRRPAR